MVFAYNDYKIYNEDECNNYFNHHKTKLLWKTKCSLLINPHYVNNDLSHVTTALSSADGAKIYICLNSTTFWRNISCRVSDTRREKCEKRVVANYFRYTRQCLKFSDMMWVFVISEPGPRFTKIRMSYEFVRPIV